MWRSVSLGHTVLRSILPHYGVNLRWQAFTSCRLLTMTAWGYYWNSRDGVVQVSCSVKWESAHFRLYLDIWCISLSADWMLLRMQSLLGWLASVSVMWDMGHLCGNIGIIVLCSTVFFIFSLPFLFSFLNVSIILKLLFLCIECCMFLLWTLSLTNKRWWWWWHIFTHKYLTSMPIFRFLGRTPWPLKSGEFLWTNQQTEWAVKLLVTDKNMLVTKILNLTSPGGLLNKTKQKDGVWWCSMGSW